jgi:hypothetical protein
MREQDLKRVLLVAAVEDADREGVVLPPADRDNAAREARRQAGATADAARLLSLRAAFLRERIVQRHPFVADIERHAGGIAAVGALVVLAGFALGLGLSALDGERRINVLAYPFAGLVAWNLVVYAMVAAHALRARGATARGRWLPEALASVVARRVAAFVARSRSFHATLAEALGRFAQSWQRAARPVLVARAARTFHLAAAAAGLGLVAGLYLRGIAFDYRAGWESTFLDAEGARRVIAVLYAPGSWVTGLALPDAAHLEAIRWRDGRGGEGAARWIHLLAASVLVVVVVPRLLLALLATLQGARAAATLPLPGEMQAHAREAFGAFGGVGEGAIEVIPYAYEPSAEALARLPAVLARELGRGLVLDVRPALAYGAEEDALKNRERAAAATIVLVNLASTPEDETHGRLLESLRDAKAAVAGEPPLLVLVDEAPYLTRMGGGTRVEERRRAWQSFVAARGLQARFEKLA